MTLSFPRKVILYLVEVGIRVLWVIDKITNFSLRDLLSFLKVFFASVISLIFVLFLVYSYRFDYLKMVAEGLFLSNDPISNSAFISSPIVVRKIPEPQISAKSALAVDRKTNKVLFEKEPSLKVLPASTVKLMTAAVSLDVYKLDEEVEVSRYCSSIEGTKAMLPEGKVFKVSDLISVMLVGSAGDAACTLATFKISEKDFVGLMNKKAKEIGMELTKFSNPVGLENINGGHYSTAWDLYKLAKYATSISFIKDVVGKNNYIISSVDNSFSTTLMNTNKLLWEVPGTIGVKTGTTENAGEVLVYEYKDGIEDVIIVVMGSKDRFGDTKLILNWINSSYSWN